MPLSRKATIAALLNLKSQGRLFQFFSKGKVPRVGAHTIQEKPALESLRRAILSTAPVEKINRMSYVEGVGGSSELYHLKLRGGQDAIFKPYSKGGQSEYLAYEVSRILGFPKVPATSIRKVDIGKNTPKLVLGSAQQWIKGDRKGVRDAIDSAARIHQESRGKVYPDALKQYDRIKLYDYIIGNADRAPGNMVWHPKRLELIAIDQADAFSPKNTDIKLLSPNSAFEKVKLEKTVARFHTLPQKEKRDIISKVERLVKKRRTLETSATRIASEKEELDLNPVFQRTEHLLTKLKSPVSKSARRKSIWEE